MSPALLLPLRHTHFLSSHLSVRRRFCLLKVLHVVAIGFVLSTLGVQFGFSQGPTSAIPQKPVPLIPGYSYVIRDQAAVNSNGPFTGRASLGVQYSKVVPTDWAVTLETAFGGGYEVYPTYIGVSNVGVGINPQVAQFLYDATVEAPATEPLGVVAVPPDVLVPEALPNPAVHNPPAPVLVSADDSYSFTVAPPNHKLAKIVVVSKVMQREPDKANGGTLRIVLSGYNIKKGMWVEKQSGTFSCYQLTVMDAGAFPLYFDSGEDREFIDILPNGNAFVRWRVQLTNGNGQVVYGTLEGRLLVWRNVLPSA